METKNLRNIPTGELCEVHTNGVVVEMFRSAKYTGNREDLNGFRPAKILKDGAVVWTFQNSGADTMLGQFGELLELDDDDYIIVIRDRITVFAIVRVSDFAHCATAKIGDKLITVGGTSADELLSIKCEVACKFDLDYWYSAEEEQILHRRTEESRKVSQEANAGREAELQAARAARLAKIATIVGRKPVEAWSAEGKRFFGTPVETNDEWMCLADGKFCIMMKDGQPTEAFIVVKKGPKVKKAHATEVSGTKPGTKEINIDFPTATEQRSITLRGETRDGVLIFADFASVKALQKAGLNSGTWVGVLPNGSDTLTVYAVKKSNIDTVGQLKKKAAALLSTPPSAA